MQKSIFEFDERIVKASQEALLLCKDHFEELENIKVVPLRKCCSELPVKNHIS